MEYEAAAARVGGRIAFLAHLTWYFWLSLIFLAVDSVLTPGAWWSVPIIGCWSLAVFLHFISAYLIGDLRGPIRKRWIREELTHAEGRSRQ